MPTRFLKESITTSATIERLTEPEEVFFYRLIVVCDDFGRIDARPAILRAKCYPLRMARMTEERIANLLAGICRAGLAAVYTHNNKPYLQICTWTNHQQTRAKTSKCPAYDDEGSNLLSPVNICNHLLSDTQQVHEDAPGDPVISVITDNGISDTESEPVELTLISTEGLPKEPKPAKPTVRLYEAEYREIIAHYPGGKPVSNQGHYEDGYRNYATHRKQGSFTKDEAITYIQRYARFFEASGWDKDKIYYISNFFGVKGKASPHYLKFTVDEEYSDCDEFMQMPKYTPGECR